MSRTAHRLFSSSLRFSTRANLTVARSSRAALTRRMMSSESHASHGGSTRSDTPWIIGSALVFGPLFLYLVSPTARKGSYEHTDHGHKSHHNEHGDKHMEADVTPIADDEGTEVSGQEVKESMEKAFEADSPKDAQEQEEVVAKAETTAVQENSASEAQSQAASSTDVTPVPESGLNPTPSAPVRVDADEVTLATSDEKAQSTAGDKSEPSAESTA